MAAAVALTDLPNETNLTKDGSCHDRLSYRGISASCLI